jgi:hypothetical protein
MTRWWLLVIAALCWWQGVARANDEPLYKCAPAPDTTKIRAYFNGDPSVLDLVTWLMGFTCKVVLIDSDVPKHVTKVTVLAPHPMTPKQAVRLFFDAMDAAGLAVTEKGDTVIIKLGPRFPKGCPGAAPAASPTPPPPPAGTKPAAAAPSTSIRQIDAGHYGVPTSLRDRLAANPALLDAMARVTPVVANGKQIGLQLSAIQARSPLAKVGLLDGDILTRANGFEFWNPEKGRQVLATLLRASKEPQGLSLLEFEILRGGKPRTIEIAFE